MSGIVVTGGTGTFGRAFVRRALASGQWDRVISLSRDEVKASRMVEEFGQHAPFKAFLGDVRDRDRLLTAFHGVDVVVHAAALKRVDMGAYSPSEIKATNVDGTENVVRAAIAAGVGRVVIISSDKAVAPTNVYGMSKGMAEMLAVQENNYGWPRTRISAVRYGNVLGSRGSVVSIWRQQAAAGQPLTITDPRMTRFIMTIEQAVELVLYALAEMEGGEVFVPALPSAYMFELASAVRSEFLPLGGDEPWWRETGLRPGGEKMAEALLNEEEPSRCWKAGGCYVVLPTHHDWTAETKWPALGEPLPADYVYRSDTNTRWLTAVDLGRLIAETEAGR